MALAALTLGGARANAACVLGQIAELPVTMSHMKALLNAKFNGHDIQLAADSGAFYSMISRADALRLGLVLRPAPPNLYVVGTGGAADVELTTVQTFSLAGSELHNVEFLVGGTALDVVGLLGRNVLAFRDTEYDLGEGAIRLFRPRGCNGANLDYWAKGRPDTVVPMLWSEGAAPPAIVEVKINGVAIRALLDSGAGSSGLSLGAARRVGIDVNGPGVVRTGGTIGIGRRIVRAWLAPISTFEIGGEKISNVKIAVADTSSPDYDMLVGADFFLSHRILISNSQRKVYITYQGGPVFDAAEHPRLAPQNQALADGAEPTDAEGYSRRGAAFLDRGENERALADFDKAVAMAPKEPRYLVQRAQARMALHRPVVAMSDIDAALALDPGDVDALIARAVLRRNGGDETGALADIDAVAKSLPPQAVQRLDLGAFYLGLDRFDAAVDQFDLWVRYHPEDARLGAALNGRCWARALAGEALDRALSDCNRAVGLYPNSAEVRDSRGLVRLRRGEYDRAIADYDAALKLDPKLAWSLYGRGLAELKTGSVEAGRADIAAGEALAPKLAERARKLDIVADPGSAEPAPTPPAREAVPTPPVAPGTHPPA